MYYDIKCPYCAAGQEVCHYDEQDFDADDRHEMKCAKCKKYFVFTTSISYSYTSSKAACLNGADHTFRPSVASPKCYTTMHCCDCDYVRSPTREERLEHNIPRIPSLF